MKDARRRTIEPFPFEAFERLSRAELAVESRLRAFGQAHFDVEKLETALSDLVDEPVRIFVRRSGRSEARKATDAGIGVAFSLPWEKNASRRALIDVEVPLAVAVVSRALRKKAPRLTDSSAQSRAEIAGAFGGVVAAALRRAHKNTALRIVGAGAVYDVHRDHLGANANATSVWLTVVVGPDAFGARIDVPDAASLVVARPAFTVDALHCMHNALIAVPIVVTSVGATRDDLAALAAGDRFVFTAKNLSAKEDGSLVGTVTLIPSRGELGIAADLADDGRLVLRGEIESHPWERTMPSSSNSTVEVLENAPVVVRVELGSVEMKAREWAALNPGDVITLGRKLGEPAIIRVGGVELARGELVTVDGEYSVRIVARADVSDATRTGGGS